MAIDIIFVILLLLAVFKGLQRGLLVAIFSVVGCVAGLAAAIKLSAIVSVYLKDDMHMSSRWVPVISFILVFLAVVLLVRWLADMVEMAIDFAMMEWVNRLGGVALYVLLYISVYSVFLFYATQSGMIGHRTIDHSRSYNFIEPWGPAIMNELGRIIPIFKDMFGQLEAFFGGLSK
jgi:membrane protein required for colicin V production